MNRHTQLQRKTKIKELTLRIELHKQEKKDISDKYLKAFAPMGYKTSTSYEDQDTIRGSREELDVFDYQGEINRLNRLIELDTTILNNIIKERDIEGYISDMTSNKDKVRYLRNVEGFKQREIAELLEIHIRTVQKMLSE